jgi:hypothetical protein
MNGDIPLKDGQILLTPFFFQKRKYERGGKSNAIIHVINGDNP